MNEKNTRERILDCAGRIFAQRGFRDTTVADICEAAEANIAAINYHFGGKDLLYKEVWQHTRDTTRLAYPLPDFQSDNAGQWIRDYVRCRVLAILDEGAPGWFPRIVGREMMQPSPQHENLRATFLRPGKQQLEAAVRMLLGSAATELQVHCAMVNVLSLCAFLNSRRCIGGGAFCGQSLNAQQATEVVNQIAAFALGGLCEIRNWLDRKESHLKDKAISSISPTEERT